MPIYEYNCTKCNHRFEQLRPISQCDADAECPKCQKPAKRAVSKFISRSQTDLSYLSHMANSVGGSSGGSSCSSCSSGNCSTCGGS